MDDVELIKQHSNILNLPIYPNFEELPIPTKQTIFMYNLDIYTYQLVINGPVEDQNVEELIDKIINKTCENSQLLGFKFNDKFFKEVDTKFKFYIHVQDLIHKDVTMRVFACFFVEPTYNDIYQFLTTAVSDEIDMTKIDIKNDVITKSLYDYAMYFINNIEIK